MEQGPGSRLGVSIPIRSGALALARLVQSYIALQGADERWRTGQWCARRKVDMGKQAGGIMNCKGVDVDTCRWKLAMYYRVTMKVGNTYIMIHKTGA